MIQPQNVVGIFQGIIAEPRFKARRIAFVVGGSLAKMQLRRILDGRDTRYFDDRAAAETWLFEPSGDPQDRGSIAAHRKSERELIAEWANEELLASVRAPAEERPAHLARGRLYLDMLAEGLDGAAWQGHGAGDTCPPRWKA